MKRTFSLLISVWVFILAAAGQDIPVKDQTMIDDFIISTISITKERIESQAVAQVFNGTFYYATPTYNRDGGTSSCEKYSVVIEDGKISELEQNTETASLKQLTSLVRKDFAITGEGDAYIFEAALDGLYPLDWSDEPNDKKHFMRDGKWFFIRGKFFDAQKAFIVTLDQNKKIIQIDYELEAVKNQ